MRLSMILQPRSIQARLLAMMSVALLIGCTVMATYVGEQTRSKMFVELEAKGEAVAKAQANALTTPIWEFNTDEISAQLEALVTRSDIVQAVVLDASGERISEARRAGHEFASDQLISLDVSVSHPEEGAIGSLHIDLSPARVESNIRQSLIAESLDRPLFLRERKHHGDVAGDQALADDALAISDDSDLGRHEASRWMVDGFNYN